MYQGHLLFLEKKSTCAIDETQILPWTDVSVKVILIKRMAFPEDPFIDGEGLLNHVATLHSDLVRSRVTCDHISVVVVTFRVNGHAQLGLVAMSTPVDKLAATLLVLDDDRHGWWWKTDSTGWSGLAWMKCMRTWYLPSDSRLSRMISAVTSRSDMEPCKFVDLEEAHFSACVLDAMHNFAGNRSRSRSDMRESACAWDVIRKPSAHSDNWWLGQSTMIRWEGNAACAYPEPFIGRTLDRHAGIFELLTNHNTEITGK